MKYCQMSEQLAVAQTGDDRFHLKIHLPRDSNSIDISLGSLGSSRISHKTAVQDTE